MNILANLITFLILSSVRQKSELSHLLPMRLFPINIEGLLYANAATHE